MICQVHLLCPKKKVTAKEEYVILLLYKLDGVILPTITACDTLARLQNESRRVNRPITSLRQTHASVNCPNSARRPVVNLSYAR